MAARRMKPKAGQTGRSVLRQPAGRRRYGKFLVKGRRTLKIREPIENKGEEILPGTDKKGCGM